MKVLRRRARASTGPSPGARAMSRRCWSGAVERDRHVEAVLVGHGRAGARAPGFWLLGGESGQADRVYPAPTESEAERDPPASRL